MGASGGSLRCCNALEGFDRKQEKRADLAYIMQTPAIDEPEDGRCWSRRASSESPRIAEQSSKLGMLFTLDVGELNALRTGEAEQGAEAATTRPPYHFRSGAVYTGQWLGNARHGFGVQRWPDGTRYEGQWASNQAEGRGRMKFANGDRYTGEWHANAFHGLGAYRATDGTSYFGEWHEDTREGHGLEIAIGGVKYAGEFHSGCKDGRGLCLWPDGGQFSGDWRDDQIAGFGVHRNAKGGVFRGSWRAAARHGIGCYVWSDGRCYMGYYRDNLEVGLGCYLDETGFQCTVGHWNKGTFHRQAPHTTDLDFIPALRGLALLQPEPTTPGSDEIVMVRTPSWDSIPLSRCNSGSQASSSSSPSDVKRAEALLGNAGRVAI